MATRVPYVWRAAAKPVLSLSFAEARRGALNLYRAWYRQVQKVALEYYRFGGTVMAIVSAPCIDPFLGIFVATVFILEVKLKRLVRQFQSSLTKLSALLQVVVQFRYNI